MRALRVLASPLFRVHFAKDRATSFDKSGRYGQNNAPRESAPTCGDVAQLGEHHVRNVGAEGSNPFISTTEKQEAEASFVLRPPFFCPVDFGKNRGSQ